MKKILILSLIFALSTSITFAANPVKSAAKATANQVKADVKSTNSALKEAVKQDINNTVNAQASTAASKKAEKIKQIDAKLAELNKQAAKTKEDKNITETQRVLQLKTIQSQIDFYTKQKEALK